MAVRAIETTSKWNLVVAGLEAPIRSEKITCLGRVETETLRRLYAASDLMLVTSRYEGFSVAIMEALASGLPVAIRRTLSNTEVLTHGEAFLADRDEDFAKILTALELDARPLRLANAAARAHRSDHSAGGMADRYSELLANLARRGGTLGSAE